MACFFSAVIRACWLLAVPAALMAQFSVQQLSPQTTQEFDVYQKAAEAHMDWQAHVPPEAGKITVVAGDSQPSTSITGGLVHDWRAAALAPGGTVEQALAVLQDYANYKSIYTPEVVDSKELSHDGSRYRVYLRLIKKKLLTVVLDSEYEVEYRPLGQGRWAVLSRSTSMAEVDGTGKLAPGAGHGFLWRLNAYWLIEPRSEGVYLECRSISLSRDIPAGLGWLLRPVVTSLPRESLNTTLAATVRAISHERPVVSQRAVPASRNQ